MTGSDGEWHKLSRCRKSTAFPETVVRRRRQAFEEKFGTKERSMKANKMMRYFAWIVLLGCGFLVSSPVRMAVETLESSALRMELNTSPYSYRIVEKSGIRPSTITASGKCRLAGTSTIAARTMILWAYGIRQMSTIRARVLPSTSHRRSTACTSKLPPKGISRWHRLEKPASPFLIGIAGSLPTK